MQPYNGRKPTRSKWQLYCCFILLALLIALPVTAAGAAKWTVDSKDTVFSISASADASRVVVGSRDNTITVYDNNGKKQWEFKADNAVTGVAMNSDGTLVAAVSADRDVRLFDGQGQVLWTYATDFPLLGVAIADDGGYVSVASVEGKNLLFLNRAGQLVWEKNLIVPVESTAIYGSGNDVRVLAGTRDSRIYLFDSSGNELYTIQMNDVVHSLAVTSSGSRIAAATGDGIVSVIDGSNGKILWQMNARRERGSDQMRAVGMSADGSVVAAGISYGDVFIFDSDGKLQQQIKDSNEDIQAVYVSRDGKVLMYGGAGRRTTVTNLSAQAASYATQKTSTRWFIIGGIVLLLAIVGGGVLAVRRTQWGAKAWNGALLPVRILIRSLWRARGSYLFLLPTFALLILFNYYPAISGLWHGFTKWSPGLRATWVGFQNYIGAFNDVYLRVGILNAIILVVTGFAQLAMPLLVAEFIFNLRSGRLKYILRTAYILPLVVPGVVGILMWVNIYDPNYGLLNQFLKAMHLESLIRVWLGDPQIALGAIIFMGFPWIGAFPLLMFYGGLISIPTDLFDAATVDGANIWQRFIHIDFPLLLTPLRTLLILGFIGGVQAFGNIYLTTMGGPGHSTYVPALELYFQATTFNRMGMASAIGTLLFIFILGGTILNLRYIRGSETEYQA
jgi:ABC-type sugar transport system permease subunit/outer membrane protein assembly factor BamB